MEEGKRQKHATSTKLELKVTEDKKPTSMQDIDVACALNTNSNRSNSDLSLFERKTFHFGIS